MEKEGWLLRDSGINTSSSFYRAVIGPVLTAVNTASTYGIYMG
jgi:hypothetical protein